MFVCLFIFSFCFLPEFLFPIITLSHAPSCSTYFKRLILSYRIRSHLVMLSESFIIFLWSHLPSSSALPIVLEADSCHSCFCCLFALWSCGPLFPSMPPQMPVPVTFAGFTVRLSVTLNFLPLSDNTPVFQFPLMVPRSTWDTMLTGSMARVCSLLWHQSLTRSLWLANMKKEKEKSPEYTQGYHTLELARRYSIAAYSRVIPRYWAHCSPLYCHGQ